MPDSHRPIRLGLWIYFWLLLLEGVLRKWVFPQLSDLLFIVRDPVVIIIYGLALRAGVFPFRPAMVTLAIIMAASVVFALGSTVPPVVVAFGLRTNYLHLPLVFVMAAVMDRSDVLRFGRWVMILAVPVALLMFAQFRAGSDSWLNVTVGGTEGGQLRGALGRIRPPGPFSFVTGPVVYFALVVAFVCQDWMDRSGRSRLVLWLATMATVVVVPVSISRALMLSVLIVLAFAGVSLLRNLRALPSLVGPAVAILAYLAFMFNTVYVQAFVTRWDEAAVTGQGDAYSSVVGRVVRMFSDPFTLALNTPFFGHGIGMGTVAGARLMTGKLGFLLAESELSRIVLELGPVLGFAFIAWRAWLVLQLLGGGWSRLQSASDPLPWLLAGATFFNVLIGQWGQATQLGFAIFGAGLTLAAMNDSTDAPPVGEPVHDLSTGWGRR